MITTCGTAEDAARVEGLRVLLAEDNIVNQKVAVHLLRRLGCEVEAVPNGRAAVEAVVRESYDVILMDLQMPELDGLAATAAIRQLPTPRRSLPIIAVTANSMRGDREMCLGAGMDDYLPKPVTGDGLLAMLIKWDARAPQEPITMQAESNVSIYDPTVLGESFGDDREFVSSVLSEYMQSAAQQIQALATAHQMSDFATLERVAHTLKGSSRTVGAMRLAMVCADLEAMGVTRDMTKAPASIASLRDEYRLLLQELQSQLPPAC